MGNELNELIALNELIELSLVRSSILCFLLFK
jgi:hypothetical protein